MASVLFNNLVAFPADATENTSILAINNTRQVTIPSGTTAVVATVSLTAIDINNNGTITSAATLYIKDAPTEGGTNNNALRVDAGTVLFDESLTIGGALLIATNDGAAIGVSGTGFSDVFLASGAVINFAAGDITLTHSSNTLTVGGGTLATGAITASTVTTSGIISVDNTTDSTSTTTGSIHTDGGIGVVKKIQAGDDIVFADGKGLDFSATADGGGSSTDTEKLTDYERGRWIVLITTSAGSGTITYSQATDGHYVKNGDMVYVEAQLNVTSFASRTGSIKLGGLPFTVAASSPGWAIDVNNCTGLAVVASESLTGQWDSSATTGSLRIWEATTGTNVIDVGDDIASDTLTFDFSGYYQV